MTVGRRENLFADPKETERLIGRVLAGNEINTIVIHIFETSVEQHQHPHFMMLKTILAY